MNDERWCFVVAPVPVDDAELFESGDILLRCNQFGLVARAAAAAAAASGAG